MRLHTDKRDAKEGVSEQEILDFLRKNPDFFQRHEAALYDLSLPHESGSAVSLVEKQIDILRERNVAMRKRMNELLQAARSNDEIFAKTRSLNLALLEVNSWHELNEVLATHVLVDFEADFVCTHIVDANMALALDHIQHHIKNLPFLYLQTNTDAACTVLRQNELEIIFPMSDHDESGSAVILALNLNIGTGALCIGSRDANRFAKGMDTLFVKYIADILGKVMNRLAD
jgi:uncharacterized protein YigA (DUF484 family)